MVYDYNPFDRENRSSLLWLGLIGAVILWEALEAPLTFVLDRGLQEHHLWWDGLFSLIFLTDVYLKVKNKLSFPERDEDRPKPYFKSSWFYFDLLTSMPFAIIAALLSQTIGFELSVNIVATLRLARVVRIVRLRVVFDLLDFIPKPMKLGLIAVSVALLIHWIACGWMMIHPRTVAGDTDFYILSLYWTVTTLTTVGYGDITPNTNLQRLFTMGVMLVGVGVYGVIIGQVSRLMMLADKYTEERKEKMANLHSYMKYYNIPASLQRQVFSFYNHLIKKNISDQDFNMIKDLPQALQNELNIYTKIKLIREVHIFKQCSTPCLKMIAERLEQTFHSPNEYLIQKGDIGNEMFIIGHGEVQVNIGEKVVAELKAGQFFGEIALLEDTIRNADVKSKAYCDLYTFKKDDFLEVISKYPDLGERFRMIYRKRSGDRGSETANSKEAA
ncbi:MAG: hypothetical protein CME65_05665 [Halobacteriovoraceae bacterium]|nr:hypothetical protein [Halobacteriovoraceae bacterium]